MEPHLKKDRPSYVRFEKRAVEDREASIKNGHYSTKDVDFVVITPFGSADEIPREAQEWLAYQRQQVSEGRLPDEWYERYKAAYNRWKKNEEEPEEGTPIKDWPPLSPAERQNLLAMNIRTVEDLATINESGIARIGMGGHALKQKAARWLEAANDTGKLAERITAIEISNKRLEDQNAAQAKLIQELKARNEALEKASAGS